MILIKEVIEKIERIICTDCGDLEMELVGGNLGTPEHYYYECPECHTEIETKKKYPRVVRGN